jgi:D-serine deaminase-like pyridoxal phosphate-dependent protein
MEIAQRPRRLAKRRRKAVDETPKQEEQKHAVEAEGEAAPESASAMAIETQNEAMPVEDSSAGTTPARRVAKRRRKDTATAAETTSVEPLQSEKVHAPPREACTSPPACAFS